MEKLYKVLSDWEIQFESGEKYKFPVILENTIVYRRNFKAIDIKVCSYCDELLIEKIQNEKIKVLKECFDISDEEGKIIDSSERIHDNIDLYDITNHSEANNIG